MTAPRAERRVVSAATHVDAEPRRIFQILTDITQHALIDGSGTLTGTPAGPVRLVLGSEFSMGMRQAGREYRSLNRVVELDPDRRLAWESIGVWRGHKVVGGQRWRWQLTPTDTGTEVVASYVWGYATLALLTVWLPGFPRRVSTTLPRSLDQLRHLLDTDGPP